MIASPSMDQSGGNLPGTGVFLQNVLEHQTLGVDRFRVATVGDVEIHADHLRAFDGNSVYATDGADGLVQPVLIQPEGHRLRLATVFLAGREHREPANARRKPARRLMRSPGSVPPYPAPLP